ncbi:hypothetical protein EXIGLDRAFT_55494, partial [Exidia glandulosa HHB12029]
LDVDVDCTDPNGWQTPAPPPASHVGIPGDTWTGIASRAALLPNVRVRGVTHQHHPTIMALFAAEANRRSLALEYPAAIIDYPAELTDNILSIFAHLQSPVNLTVSGSPALYGRFEVLTFTGMGLDEVHREVTLSTTEPGRIIASFFDQSLPRTSVRSLTLDASLWKVFLQSCGDLPNLEHVLVRFPGGPYTSSFGDTVGAPSTWPSLRTLRLVGVGVERPILTVQTILNTIHALRLPEKMQVLVLERIDLLGPTHELAQMDAAQRVVLPQ